MFLFVPSQGARMVLWFRIFEFGSQNLTLTHSPSKPLNFLTEVLIDYLLFMCQALFPAPGL